MLLVGLLRAGLAPVAAFFLALAAGDAFVASGVLLDGAVGATALFLFVGEDRLAEHVEGDAVNGHVVFVRDGHSTAPDSEQPLGNFAGFNHPVSKLISLPMRHVFNKFL